jgi:LmbE family N-acetylglucosaminyl deacetylase
LNKRQISQLIKQRIKQAGSLRAAARELGVSPSFLGYVRDGRYGPGKLAQLLELIVNQEKPQ